VCFQKACVPFTGAECEQLIWRRLAGVSNFLLIAKAGGSGEAAENTCAAVTRAAALQVPSGVELAIEVDLRLSSEGQLVAFHHPCLERTTNGKGLVRARSVPELRRLIAGPCGERIPVLPEVLDAARDRPLLFDLHDDDVAAATALCRALARLPRQRRELLWVASEHDRVVETVRRLDPMLRTAARSSRHATAQWAPPGQCSARAVRHRSLSPAATKCGSHSLANRTPPLALVGSLSFE
jgi:glycerophosphoryl diester phosphodiesterase